VIRTTCGRASRLAVAPLILPVFSVSRLAIRAALRDLVPFSVAGHKARLSVVAIAVCLSACRGSPTASLDAAAEFYVRAALALGERDADSLDIYDGPGAWRADARARHLPLDDIRAATVPFISSLDERPFDNAEAEARRRFLLRQTRAIVSRVDIVRGARPSFSKKRGRCSGWMGRTGRIGRMGRMGRNERFVRNSSVCCPDRATCWPDTQTSTGDS
jgi:hypothetical protein